MKNSKISVILGLLALAGGAIAPEVIGLSAPAMAQFSSSDPVRTTGVVERSDVPSEFRELPSTVAQSISDRLRLLTRFLGQDNFQFDRYSAFVNPTDLQVVLGFRGRLPSQTEQYNFDAAMQQLQQPQGQQELLNLLRRGTSDLFQINILDFQPLNNLNGVGDSSTGVKLTVQMRNQVWKIDMIPFRRGGVGALVAVVYPQSVSTPLSVVEVARKLDSRLLNEY